MSNPYDKIFDDPNGSGFGKSRLAHGLYDTNINQNLKPRFGRLLVLASVLLGIGLTINILANGDPIVDLMLQQSQEDEERRQKMKDSGLIYPASMDL